MQQTRDYYLKHNAHREPFSLMLHCKSLSSLFNMLVKRRRNTTKGKIKSCYLNLLQKKKKVNHGCIYLKLGYFNLFFFLFLSFPFFLFVVWKKMSKNNKEKSSFWKKLGLGKNKTSVSTSSLKSEAGTIHKKERKYLLIKTNLVIIIIIIKKKDRNSVKSKRLR